ncbi:hypothetical protein Terro_3723 [Terriglobus roseus DSM 18391]|uniref:Uncharacterized protein n=1 Tax=Terriglobus roseus (strain DSM 18391 / NRRL B-41598 / KBS 63) TaxID=926566 RepID=I3ZL16_TERRK|nr:hypothetical protein Terro_3723 [Terriglobus roseus DSM 18391]
MRKQALRFVADDSLLGLSGSFKQYRITCIAADCSMSQSTAG